MNLWSPGHMQSVWQEVEAIGDECAGFLRSIGCTVDEALERYDAFDQTQIGDFLQGFRPSEYLAMTPRRRQNWLQVLNSGGATDTHRIVLGIFCVQQAVAAFNTLAIINELAPERKARGRKALAAWNAVSAYTGKVHQTSDWEDLLRECYAVASDTSPSQKNMGRPGHPN